MSAPSPYGSPQDWASIISSATQGAGSGMQSASSNANSKAEAKEAKRRTLANLLGNALKTSQGLFRVGREQAENFGDLKSTALQQMARGFIDSLQGSTGY